MNQVGLVGRFTKDPVLRYLSGNRVQTHFSLAINRNFKRDSDEAVTIPPQPPNEQEHLKDFVLP